MRRAITTGSFEPSLDNGIDALIVANTTISRPPLQFGASRARRAGCPAAPLKALALEPAARFPRRHRVDEIPLIAVGGIENADDAWDRIVAGASLVQLYSAMVYEGPGLAKRIADGLAKRLRREGMASIAEAVGSG